MRLKETEDVARISTKNDILSYFQVLPMICSFFLLESPKKTNYIVIKPTELQRGTGNTCQFAIAEIEIQCYEKP